MGTPQYYWTSGGGWNTPTGRAPGKGRSPRGMSVVGIQVIGVQGIHRAIAPLLEPELTAAIDKANKEGAKRYGKRLRPAVGARSSKMRKAVRVRRAKTGKPGWIVGSRRKIAFFWPFIIGGTRDHGPRRAKALVFMPGWNPYSGASSKGVGHVKGSGRGGYVRTQMVRGVKADNIVERVASQYEHEIVNVINDAFAKETGL